MASERDRLLKQGLSIEVVNIILADKAPGTITEYESRWGSFVTWCGDRVDPIHCPIEMVLKYLQYLESKDLAFNTIKGYAVALTAFHAGFPGEKTIMTHRLARRFLRGIQRLRPAVRNSAPSWDLPLVLEALCQPPFEPMEQAEISWISKKAAFLVAITSGKRASDMVALSVQPGCFTLTGDRSKLVLRPDPSLHPKMLRANRQVNSLVLNAFYPAPVGAEQVRLHCLCPVRAVAEYVDRTQDCRTTDRLFVAYGGGAPGRALSKQRIAHWMVDCITWAYSQAGIELPKVRAHSTRKTAASVACLRGVPIEEILQAADWASPTVFISRYMINVPGAMQAAILGSAARC